MTPTLKMLLGLIKPTSGSAKTLDNDPGSETALSRVGALIESPAFYPYLSGRDNLRVIARYSGVATKTRITEVLRQVGLSQRAGDKFKRYSMGMKQRLGVAAALLEDPELLILDEPTNGLDPEGTAEMREFINSLGREKTVLLSSHMLGEVEQICDRVGVIRRGAMVAEGTVDELRGQQGLLVKAEPAETALRVARKLIGVEKAVMKDGMLQLTTDPERAPEIVRAFVSVNIAVKEIRPSQQSLVLCQR